MTTRRMIAALGISLLGAAGCRQAITSPPPPGPPFPPDLETSVTTGSGLVFEALGEVVSTNPMTFRITATVTNPTDEDIVAKTLREPCRLIVLASWPEYPYLRIVQPLDGLGSNGSILGVCTGMRTLLTIAAGEVVQLMKDEDLVLSEALGARFAPGRHVLSAIFVDEFIYEVLAIDTDVPD